MATIRVRGHICDLEQHAPAMFHAANGRAISEQIVGRIAFGRWGGPEDGEDVVICRTAADSLEIHCHGGDAAVRRILDDLSRAGYQVEDWQGQLTRGCDALEADCLKALSQASTWRTAEILHEQSCGLLRHAIEELQRQIDSNPSNALVRLDSLLQWSRFGIHLSQPWNVVLTGRPNVGKSSLINALLGYQRAIVFDQPGTTRDVVTAETAFDGWPVVLADTAGLRETSEELEAAGIALARQQLKTADARLVLIDLNQPPTLEDEDLIHRWPDALVIGHKCDLDDRWRGRLPALAVRVSSVTGEGLDEVQRRLVKQLIPSVPDPGTPIPITQNQVDLLEGARQELAIGRPSTARQLIEQIIGR